MKKSLSETDCQIYKNSEELFGSSSSAQIQDEFICKDTWNSSPQYGETGYPNNCLGLTLSEEEDLEKMLSSTVGRQRVDWPDLSSSEDSSSSQDSEQTWLKPKKSSTEEEKTENWQKNVSGSGSNITRLSDCIDSWEWNPEPLKPSYTYFGGPQVLGSLDEYGNRERMYTTSPDHQETQYGSTTTIPQTIPPCSSTTFTGGSNCPCFFSSWTGIQCKCPTRAEWLNSHANTFISPATSTGRNGMLGTITGSKCEMLSDDESTKN